jgi:Ran GTPase-activating protein (RanGAP) involved in mRNA processing and transport
MSWAVLEQRFSILFSVFFFDFFFFANKAFGATLPCSQLSSLDVDGCHLTGESAVVLLDAVRKSQLIFLNVSRNDLGGENNAAAAVSQMLRSSSCKLRELVLVGTGLTEAGCVLLGEAMKKAKCLSQISLWGARLGVQGAAAFRDALCSASVLTVLDLRGTDLGLAGIAALAKGIEMTSQLNTLDVSGNGLGTEGAQLLGEAVGKNQSLKILFVNGNNIGNDGLKVFVFLLFLLFLFVEQVSL